MELVPNHKCRVSFIANAGILIACEHTKIMIDGLSDSLFPIYTSTPTPIKQQIICGMPPFDALEIMLFTHEHGDHFDPQSTLDFMRKNTRCIIMANQKSAAALACIAREPSPINNLYIVPKEGLTEKTAISKVLHVEAFLTQHEGKEHAHVENIAYLITLCGRTILNVGDAKPSVDNFCSLQLKDRDIDLLIVPFPYVGLPSARKIVSETIRPKKIVALHFPNIQHDKKRWTISTKNSYIKVKDRFAETIFFENTGDWIDI